MKSCLCAIRSPICPAQRFVPPSLSILLMLLTSKTASLPAGEFALAEWRRAGLNVEAAVKRGVFTIRQRLIRESIGGLSNVGAGKLEGEPKPTRRTI